MRMVMCAAVVIVALWGGALAQSNTKQSPGDTNTEHGIAGRRAPVGHRQPTPKDLPPNVLEQERKLPPGYRQLDKVLTICKGC